ncbi:DoxX-like family protein [Dactylosporangium sp. NPDC049525]|uniref:DoxX-like family protein n=1 Tax=Dactylosporangium sp. NPDC049525 TaxID=3154730 RepID=UPI003431DF24
MTTWFARAAVAAVWLYEGLWCKVLGGDGDQQAIVAAVPLLPPALAAAALTGIGLAEVAVAAWVLTGRRARAAAVTQTVLLVAFNAGGLLFAGDRIADAGRMLTANAALLALVWLLATPRTQSAPSAQSAPRTPGTPPTPSTPRHAHG